MSKLPYKLTEKKHIRLLALLGWIVCFASYITRLNFAAVLVEFIQVESVMKSAASVIITTMLITHGVGQLLSGYLGDRVAPRHLIFFGLFVAAVCNMLLPLFSPSIAVMSVIWGINGIAQAMLWPPLLKICANALSSEDYNRLVPVIDSSCASATIAVYLISPLIITLSGWKQVFYIASAFAAVAAVAWLLTTGSLLKNVSFTSDIEKKSISQYGKKGNHTVLKLLPCILLSAAMLGILKDGITTWMPTFISETFKMKSTESILSTVVIPASHMLIGLSTYRVLKAMKRDVFAAISLYFTITAGFLLLLWCSGTNSMILSTVFIALGSGGLHGINALSTYYLPELLGGTERISFYAGLLNAAIFVGSALSTFLFAVISEALGWNMTVISWVIFAFIGLALMLISMVVARKKGNAGSV